MKPGAVGLVLPLLAMPLLVSGQQSGSTKLPLVITDKEAVEEWSRAIWDGPLDPKLPSDTPFLLSLTDTEMLGRFRFRQRCALCHAPQSDLSTDTWGPLLTRRNVVGRETNVRERIMEGSGRMPAYKYTLDPVTIDAIIAYLKKVERFP
jgi:Cytochrome C oxidase, cbb3-type, subunit III